jgi:hypothetical protein
MKMYVLTQTQIGVKHPRRIFTTVQTAISKAIDIQIAHKHPPINEATEALINNGCIWYCDLGPEGFVGVSEAEFDPSIEPDPRITIGDLLVVINQKISHSPLLDLQSLVMIDSSLEWGNEIKSVTTIFVKDRALVLSAT